MSNLFSNVFTFKKLICSFLLSFVVFVSAAKTYDLPPVGSRLIGDMQYHEVIKGDYFQRIAEHYNVGFLALMAANPGVDPFLPTLGHQLVIPSQMLLPFGKREGIIINLPELRLYYFPENSDKVHVFPVGVGREGLATPKTISYIGEKRKDPVWRPTTEMKARYFVEHGRKLADEVPAGPNNPFGKYALRLGTSVYLLHGSNQRFGIGMRASSGCIRLYDDDIEWLYKHVAINTPVKIVDQTIKLSYEPNKKLIEVHSPLTPDNGEVSETDITSAVRAFVGDFPENKSLLLNQVTNPKGLVTELHAN
ncbi:MAG: L,D-transpeptidase ErfK/SrfK/L,D-transpeptidase YbiS [Cognaticolwellia sp.]|jgi:L,D-transpeptidase ErfK/SrfK/L,D-transpeptidase YbiS